MQRIIGRKKSFFSPVPVMSARAHIYEVKRRRIKKRTHTSVPGLVRAVEVGASGLSMCELAHGDGNGAKRKEEITWACFPLVPAAAAATQVEEERGSNKNKARTFLSGRHKRPVDRQDGEGLFFVLAKAVAVAAASNSFAIGECAVRAICSR